MKTIQEKVLTYLLKAFPSVTWYNDYNSKKKTSIAVNMLAGSRVVNSFLDGSKDVVYNIELIAKTTNEERNSLVGLLYKISDELENLEKLDDLVVQGVEIVSEPYFLEASENEILFALDFIISVFEKTEGR